MIGRLRPALLPALVLAVALALVAAPARAQVPAMPEGHVHDAPATGPAWTWSLESNAFVGYNRQQREFTDFDAYESQNWFMASAARTSGPWQVSFIAGGSLEPLTLRRIGSPQAFQTGETYRNAPLIDYQHPHDLVMHLGTAAERTLGRVRLMAGAALVGGPPIGPPAFMHRASALENPQVPLSHHQLDATHITHGVLSTGIGLGGLRLDGALFHGQEPDEDRTDLDTGRLDSQSVQVSYTRGAWSGQVSAAWLTRPERLSTYDAERRTASVSYTRGSGNRLVALTAAAGQNREAHGNLEAFLAEAVARPSARWAAYTRVEWLDKDILDAGFHPVGVGHRHRQSRLGAFTLGVVRDLVTGAFGRLGVGADLTTYHVPANLQEAYGQPLSMHAFVRYYGKAGRGTVPHMH